MIGFDRILTIAGDEALVRACRVVKTQGVFVNEDTGAVTDVDLSLELHWEKFLVDSRLANRKCTLDGSDKKYTIIGVVEPNGMRRKLVVDLSAKS